jgi:hypothetical protein
MRSLLIHCAGFVFLAAVSAVNPAATRAESNLNMQFPAMDSGGMAEKIYQLTNVPNSPEAGNFDWYGLYYHDDDTTIQNYEDPGSNNKLILRRLTSGGSIDASASAASLIYYSLDLSSGQLSQVTAEGTANAATVKGQWLYVMERDSASQHYFRLARYDILHDNKKQLLGDYPELAGSSTKTMSANIAVSDEQDYLIWTEEQPQARIFYLKNLVNLRMSDPGISIDVQHMPDSENGKAIEHFQFLKGRNGSQFTCIDQSKAAVHLLRVGVGRADTSHPSCVPLSVASDSPLNRYLYFHPFVDLAGHLWSDAGRWSHTGDLELHGYVRFDKWSDNGNLERNSWFEMSNTPFQVHTNYTMNPAWFLGDGATVIGKSITGKSSGGLDAIYVLHMSGDKVSSEVLARRAPGVDSLSGNSQPNAHLCRLMGRWGAVWSEWRSIIPGQKPAMNVFFAPFPDKLLMRLKAD